MKLFQILDCSTIGTCCSDYGLVTLLDITRRIIELIQLIAPIVLIVAAMLEIVKLIVNPDDKNGMKKIFNKFGAAIIIFFIPMVFDISIGVLPEEFRIAACWKNAKNIREVSDATKLKHIALSDDRQAHKLYTDPEEYQSGVPKTGGSGAAGKGAQRLINVALKQVGNNEGNGSHHKYEAYMGYPDSFAWCAAFVSWCANEAGYSKLIPKFGNCGAFPSEFQKLGAAIHYPSSGYTPKPGDIVIFSWGCSGSRSHVGIVLSSDADYIYTVEGNTSGAGEDAAKCGGHACVSRKKRPRDCTIYGYATPKYPN